MQSLDQKKALLKKLLLEKSMQKKKFRLSQGQKSMWFLQRVDTSSVDYNTGFALRLTGEIDVELFANCVAEIGDRHPVMRTAFKEDENGEYQEITSQPVSLKIIQVKDKSEEETFQLIDNKLKEAYNLEEGNLARASLFETGPNKYVFLFAFHHIIYDEWTSRLVLLDLIKLYLERQKSPSFELPPVRKGYKEFVDFQEEIIKKPELIKFWDEYLTNHETAVLEFVGDKEFMETPSNKMMGRVINTHIEPELMKGVRELCKENKVTVFNFMISVSQLALHRYSDQNQFFIGTPVAGRNNPDFHQTAGYFVNLIPLKCTINREDSFETFLKENAINNNLALAHQDFPFNRMVESFYGERSLSKHPFFNVAFTYYNQKRLQEDLEGMLSSNDNYQFEEYNLNSQESVYDITIEIKELSDSGALKVKYNASKYSDYMMNEFSNYLIQLLKHTVNHKEHSIHQITNLSSVYRVSESQGKSQDFKPEMNVYEMFRRQVEHFPEAIAVKHGEKQCTYLSILQDVERIKPQIIKYIDYHITNVGLLTNSSIEMIQGIFSILGAGGSYVPIKPGLPESRLDFLIENSGIQLLLCDKANFKANQFAEKHITVLCIEDLLINSPDKSQLPTVEITGNTPAYLMYTSGSTGTPKGIQIAHSNILNLVKNQAYAPVKNGDQIPQLSNYSFDGSVFDIFGSLLNGATLHILNPEIMKSPDALLDYFNFNTINIGFFTTALFNTLVIHNAPRFLKTFDRLLFGGEQVSTKHVLIALKHIKNEYVLVHVYGPTETTTYATFFPVSSVKDNAKTIPIGKALAGVNVSIRSKNGTFMPIGTIGEICIKGKGLARGYYKATTSGKFKVDPLSPHEAIYTTGDFGFMNENGDVVFTGRMDHQIKLRGFRIELGEIEAALYQCENVGKAVAIVHGYHTDRSMLIAVVEPRSGMLDEVHLKKELLSYLPDYMIPGKIIIQESLKLNKNAKIDRTVLLNEVEKLLSQDVPNKKEASTKNEKTLVEIWSEIFGIEEVGINESFFALGGNSLLAMRVLSRIKYTTGVELSPKDIFETPTIEELASKIGNNSSDNTATKKIKRSNRDKYLLQ
jgi:amino acid adenylation domain-containing protein